jgi:hypothetical protein
MLGHDIRALASVSASQDTTLARGIRATVGGLAVRPLIFERLAARRGLWAGVAFAAAASAIFFVHLPVLTHYFFGDDFVPLADIASRSTWGYVRDLFLLRDLTPNWRFLPGLFYLGAYRAFGLNAFPFLLASVLVHIGTAGLIFWLVRRVVGAVWPAFLAAAFFGITAAHVPTVGQVTAFNNVLAGFLLMLALVALYEGLVREQLRWWVAASAVSFAGAIAANESAAVLAPVLGLVAFWKVSEVDGWWPAVAGRWARLALLSAPYGLIGGAALIGFSACRCTEAADGAIFAAGDHLIDNLWIYLGRLLYPVGMEPLGDVGTTHLAAGLAVATLAVAALLRGPPLARISVVFLLLALVPYLPLKLWAAPRYVYMGAIPFSLLAALLFVEVARYGSRFAPVLPALLALVAFGVLGLYGWQTWNQNQFIAAWSTRWQTLVVGLQERYPELPSGSTVYVHGGPFSRPLLQCKVLPAVGEVLWGDVKLFTFYTTYLVGHRIRPGYQVNVVDAEQERFTPVHVQDASPSELLSPGDITLLPHVAPEATGNLCLRDVPTLP